MAMPRKGRRTIQVAEDIFYWTTHPDEDYYYGPGHHTWVPIEHQDNPAAKIRALLPTPDPASYASRSPGIAITPDVVRQIIEGAMWTGWNPHAARQPVELKDAMRFVSVRENVEGADAR